MDGCNANRKSHVWRLDDKLSKPVPVETQCVPKYFYSKLDPQGAEETFHEMESAYGVIAKKIWSRTYPSKRDYFGLILMMLDLHCRNVVYENLTAKENLHAYKVRMHCMRTLMGDANAPLSDPQFFERWKVTLCKTEDPSGLVTSDNPALFFTLDEISLHLVTMPVTPSCCAVAYDSRFIKATDNHLSDEDGSLLNLYQVQNCFECLFTVSELNSEQQAFVRQQWSNRKTPLGCVDEKAWTPNLLPFPDGKTFSFLLKVEAPLSHADTPLLRPQRGNQSGNEHQM